MTDKDNNIQIRGLITRGVGGLYSVRISDKSQGSAGREVLARARGVFRREKLTPTVGDEVVVEPSVEGEDYFVPTEQDDALSRAHNRKDKTAVDYVIDRICDRRNILIRPPIANLDYLFALIPCTSPDPDLLTVDKLTAIAEHSDINVVIVINKADLAPEKADELGKIYSTVGYKVFMVSAENGVGVDELRQHISSIVKETSASGGHLRGAFAGVSGAGKSTLMTRLFPDLSLKTGSLSRKTERGRHTTRHVELYPVELETGTFWLADTPGFSMLDFTRFDFFPADELAMSFREMNDCLGECRYTKCTHLVEEGCAVIEKIRSGAIHPSRHESYKRIFEEIRSVPTWKRRQD